MKKRNRVLGTEMTIAALTVACGAWRAAPVFMNIFGSRAGAAAAGAVFEGCIFYQFWNSVKPPHLSKTGKQYPKSYGAAVAFTGAGIAYLIYYATCLFCCDIAYYLCRYAFRKRVLHRIFTGAAIAAAAVITVYGLIHARIVRTKQYSITLREPAAGRHPDPRKGFENRNAENGSRNDQTYRIVQLSDLHLGALNGRRFAGQLAEKVNACRPDLVVITGDLFNRKDTSECRTLSDAGEELRAIKAPDGVFAVTGNHDPRSENEEFQEFLRGAGIRLIDDQCVEIDGGRINLIGRTGNMYEIRDRASYEGLQMKSRIGNPTIVLDHNPKDGADAFRFGADLVLSGHTHRGQFFPCNVITHFYYGRTMNYGYGKYGTSQMIVSSGAGFFQVPVRVGSDSEICCIDIEWKD